MALLATPLSARILCSAPQSLLSASRLSPSQRNASQIFLGRGITRLGALRHARVQQKGRIATVRAEASSEGSTLQTVGAFGGLLAVPVVLYSLYVLKTTGCGLPPGPGGSVGAAEGVSYLAVVGLVGWSVYTKVKTGSGLPAGPFGILGAVEGLSYLTLLAAVVVFGLQALDYGYIPPPVPGEQCFG